MASKSLEERFWSRVTKSDGCWEWRGANVRGYGMIRRTGGTNVRANRISWEIHFGPIPDGPQVLHHCDNPPFVRPEHLYLGTTADNVHDRDTRRRGRNSRKTHCLRGHPLEGANLVLERDGRRQCRECKNARWRARKLRSKSEAA